MKVLLLIFAWSFCNISEGYAQSNNELKFGLGNAQTIKYSPTSDLIAITVGNKIKLFRSGFETTSLTAHYGKIYSLNFDPEGQKIVAGYSSGKVGVWNIAQRQLEYTFQTGNNPVLACEFIGHTRKIGVLTREHLSTWKESGEQDLIAHNHYARNIAMDISEDGGFLTIIDGLGRILIYDQQLQIENEFQSDQRGVLSISVSPNNREIVTGAKDGTVYLWKVSNKGPKSLLDTHGRINSIEFSSNGKYLAVGSEYFYILSLVKEHPDLVYKKLNGAVLASSFNPNGKEICIIEDLTPNAEIFDISDLNIPPVFRLRNEGDIIAPQIYISNPPKLTNDRLNTSKGLIALKGSVFDDYGIQNLKVNGIETPIKENGKFIIHLPLFMGENQVEIQALDVNNNISLKKFIINRKNNTEQYDYQTARNFLFVVGIDDYKFWPQLSNAVKDANDLSIVLMERYNFRFSDITFLKNEQATKNNIYKGLRSMVEKVTPRDNLVIYFSGHGHFDELLNEGYWIPIDAEEDSPGNYLSNTSILKLVESIDTQHTFLVADACFSGSLFTDLPRGGYHEKVDQFKSRWGLTSGRLEAVSDGIAGNNSPFSKVLLNYLRNNESKAFSVSEMIQHVKIKVAELSNQTPLGNPLRMKGDEGGEFIFRNSPKK